MCFIVIKSILSDGQEPVFLQLCLNSGENWKITMEWKILAFEDCIKIKRWYWQEGVQLFMAISQYQNVAKNGKINILF